MRHVSFERAIDGSGRARACTSETWIRKSSDEALYGRCPKRYVIVLEAMSDRKFLLSHGAVQLNYLGQPTDIISLVKLLEWVAPCKATVARKINKNKTHSDARAALRPATRLGSLLSGPSHLRRPRADYAQSPY